MGLVHLWPIGGAQIGSIWVRDAAERCGAVSLNIGGRDFMLEPEISADFISRVGAAMTLGAITSFALAEKIGRELADRGIPSPFRFLVLAGQPSTSAMRKALKALHPQAETFDMWASTEVQTIAECSAGRHHLQEDLIVHEIIDRATGKPAAPGEPGIVVVTSLIQHTMPLIRFSMDDVVVNSVVDEQCDCGRHQPTLSASILGRSSDLLTVSGRQFLPSHVQTAFDGVAGLTGVLQIVARKDGQNDRLRVRVEASREAPPDLADDLNRRLEAHLGVAAAVELVESASVEMASSVKTQLIAWES
jgi:phenylacetate-coenzyme A ligase PaaK-like adenylate-forming protein